MVKCEICGKEFLSITHKHLRKHNTTREEYQIKYPNARLQSDELFNKLSEVQKGKKTGDSNPARRKDVREKIRASVAKRWDEGNYEDRINGMSGMKGELHPGFNPDKHTPIFLAEHKYREFLSKFEDIFTCRRCTSDKTVNVHHVDEDRSNFLPSNLEPLCVACHSHFHYKLQKKPFITIGKRFTFAAAHRLPYYEGPCNNWHGHEWTLEISLKKRIDGKTGMVLDFSVLKKIVTDYVISVFDHSCLNDYLENPTAENILIRIWEILMFDAHLKGIEKIELWETSSSSASLTKEGMLSVLSDKIETYYEGDEK